MFNDPCRRREFNKQLDIVNLMRELTYRKRL